MGIFSALSPAVKAAKDNHIIKNRCQMSEMSMLPAGSTVHLAYSLSLTTMNDDAMSSVSVMSNGVVAVATDAWLAQSTMSWMTGFAMADGADATDGAGTTDAADAAASADGCVDAKAAILLKMLLMLLVMLRQVGLRQLMLLMIEMPHLPLMLRR